MQRIRLLCLSTILVILTSCAPHRGYILPIENHWFLRAEGAPWGLLLPVKGLNKVEEKRSADGKYIYAHFNKDNWNISMFIEPVTGYCNNSVDCVAEEKIKKDPSITSAKYVKSYNVNDFTVIEYFLENYPSGLPSTSTSGAKVGGKINQSNVTALLFREGYWLDLHISFMPTDGSKIEDVAKSFKTILEKTTIVKQKI